MDAELISAVSLLGLNALSWLSQNAAFFVILFTKFVNLLLHKKSNILIVLLRKC